MRNESTSRDAANTKGELQNLISALREEGVEKGEKEACEIVEAAKREGARVIDEARTQAERIEEEAHAKAKNTMERLESQLELALRDFLLKARGELLEVLALDPIRKEAKKALSDADFMKTLIVRMVEGYETAGEMSNVDITIPDEMKKEFTENWIQMMKDKLNIAVTIKGEKGIDGFSISGVTGGMTITDSASLVEALRPFISEKFQYILDKGVLPEG